MWADQLKAAGFPDEDVRLLTPSEYPTKGNVIVRLHAGEAPNRCCISVISTWSSAREDWNFDPFVLTERDGWLYGGAPST